MVRLNFHWKTKSIATGLTHTRALGRLGDHLSLLISKIYFLCRLKAKETASSTPFRLPNPWNYPTKYYQSRHSSWGSGSLPEKPTANCRRRVGCRTMLSNSSKTLATKQNLAGNKRQDPEILALVQVLSHSLCLTSPQKYQTTTYLAHLSSELNCLGEFFVLRVGYTHKRKTVFSFLLSS